MIGRGTIVFRRGNGQNELHFVSPWSLTLSMQGLFGSPGIQNDEARKKFDAEIVANAEKQKWKPDDVVDDAELELIRKASCCIEGEEGYHKYASDAIHIIDLSKE
jgi:hypothetical protein